MRDEFFEGNKKSPLDLYRFRTSHVVRRLLHCSSLVCDCHLTRGGPPAVYQASSWCHSTGYALVLAQFLRILTI